MCGFQGGGRLGKAAVGVAGLGFVADRVGDSERERTGAEPSGGALMHTLRFYYRRLLQDVSNNSWDGVGTKLGRSWGGSWVHGEFPHYYADIPRYYAGFPHYYAAVMPWW